MSHISVLPTSHTHTLTQTGTRHERLVMFLGCGVNEGGEAFLVTEFMDGGSLDTALWINTTATSVAVSSSWMQRVQILRDVADGLSYLHLVHKSVHQDLKSPNILLERIASNDDDDFNQTDMNVIYRAKIADFGLSKIFTKGKTRINTTKETQRSSKSAIRSANWVSLGHRGFVGTPRWMAPEMMKGKVNIGPSADIYSFGVVMWEVGAQRKPWSGLMDKREIFKAVHEEKRKLPSLSSDNVLIGYEDLIRRCCEYKASLRPLIDVIQKDLQHLLEEAARFHHHNEKPKEEQDDDDDVGEEKIDVGLKGELGVELPVIQ